MAQPRLASLVLKALLGLAALPLAAADAPAPAARFWMPAILSDHMVLPAGDRAVLWGEDRPGQTVTAQLAGQHRSALADAAGHWRLGFKGLKPGGPYTLTVEGSEKRAIQDVLLGEVWLGSGQSNMEFDLRRSEGAEAILKKADRPQLRLFTVERVASFAPAKDVTGQWKLSTPESAAPFSAAAWTFGARLQAALKRPVGLVVAAWGGTPGEAWTPRADLDRISGTAALLKTWDADVDRRELWQAGQAFELEIKDLRLADDKGKEQALEHAAQAGAWQHGEKPGSSGAVSASAGAVLYSGRLQGGAWGSASVPLRADGQPADLRPWSELRFQARGKGHFIPSFSQASISDYDYYQAPDFTLSSDWQARSLPLDGLKQGGWGVRAPLTREALLRVQFAPQVPFWPDLAEVAYNGMIAPLQPFGFRGVLWYQGESNSGRPGDYAELLTVLVDAWRRGFERPDLAFAVVQLPEYNNSAGWEGIQTAQAEAVSVLKAAVLVPAKGLGDLHDIHPRRKDELGQRLFDSILKAFYGR